MFLDSPVVVPRVGLVVSTILTLVTTTVLGICLMRRVALIRSRETMPVVSWLTLIIYVDSLLFVCSTAILRDGFGLNSSQGVCSAAIFICLVCYMSTKFIYFFLVEKAYIVRCVTKPRLKSKLYLFNWFGMMLPYTIVVILNFVYRIAYINDKGVCIIGMEKIAMMPLIIFDALVNFYLTMLFVVPLRRLYTYQNTPNSRLKVITVRSFFGSLATLTSSIANLTILMVLHGEAAWICLMCCNSDILFSVLVLHWVTSHDNKSATTAASNDSHHGQGNKDYAMGTMKGTTDTRKSYNHMDRNLKSKVETHIVAAEVGSDDDIASDLKKGHPQANNRIFISVGHERTVDDMERASKAESGNEGFRANRSSEDLVAYQKH